jgi:hypothetical protein
MRAQNIIIRCACVCVLPASRRARTSVLSTRWRSAVAVLWRDNVDMLDGVVNKVSERAWRVKLTVHPFTVSCQISIVCDAWQNWWFLYQYVYISLDFSIVCRNSIWEVKSSIFWDITQCSPLKVNRHFVGTCHLHQQIEFFITTFVRTLNPAILEAFWKINKNYVFKI